MNGVNSFKQYMQSNISGSIALLLYRHPEFISGSIAQ